MKLFASLGSRVGLVVAATALPIFLFSLTGYYERREHAIAEVEKDIRHMLRTALVEERLIVDNARQVLRIMAKSKDLRLLDARQCSELAERLLATQTNFNNIGAAYPDGRVFCSGRPIKQAVNFADRAWFQDALQTRQMTRGYYLRGRITGQRAVSFGLPLLDNDGRVLAVLYVSTTLDWLDRMAESVALPDGWATLALDYEGRVIARFPDEEKLRGQVVSDRELVKVIQTRPELTVREISGLDGVERYYGIAPLAYSGADIYMAIGAPTEKIMQQIDRAFYREVLLLALVFAFSAMLGWMEFQRSFAKWALQLGAAVRRFGTGYPPSPDVTSSDIRELEDLSAAFAEMKARVEAADAQRRIDEAALRESEQRLRLALEGGDEGLLDWNVATGQAYCSPSYYTMLGYQPGEFPATFDAWQAHLHPDDRVALTQRLHAAMDAGQTSFEEVFRMRHKSGDWRWIQVRARAVEKDDAGRATRIVGTNVDVTERREAEEERKARAERVEVLLALNELAGKRQETELLTFGLEAAERLTRSRMGFLHFVNDDQETLELVTWTAAALKHCAAAFDRHYPISQAGVWANCFRERRPVVFNDYANTPSRRGVPPGHVEMTRLASIPVIDEDKVRMMLGVGNKAENYSSYDVETLQLVGNELWRIVYGARVERSLAESWERFYSIFNSISEAIFLHDAATGTIVEVNDAAMEMYGYDRPSLLGMDVGKLSTGEPPYTLEAASRRINLARAGEPQVFEWHACRRDGTNFWVEVNLRFAAIGGQDHLLAVVQDITGRKAYEAAADQHLQRVVALNKRLEDAHVQLLQSEKLASIGQLAAGVAHEINNPVGYVFSNIGSLEKYLNNFVAMLDAYEQAEPAMSEETRATVQRLRQGMDLDYLKQDVLALLTESREGINRVRKIVQDLKDFSRVGAADDWQWADLHAGLESTLNIVWNELKYKTTVRKEYGELPQIYCLPSQLNQVFMNLLVNAAHAIETQGIVTLRTGREGEWIWVEIEDTGAGIPPENLQRIFDPFFTTKAVGKGTGLGLSLSYSIVQKHSGRIDVRSEVGKGSVFRVWLPIKPEIPAADSAD